MIEDLTFELLGDYGFPKESIDRYKEWDNYESFLVNPPTGIYWASNIEKKIYSGIDGCRKYYFVNEHQIGFPQYCLDLYPEFIRFKMLAYLKAEKEIAMSLFVEEIGIKSFLTGSKEYLKERIEEIKAEISSSRVSIITSQLSRTLTRLQWCLAWLENSRVEDFKLFEGFHPAINKSLIRIKIDGFLEDIKIKCFDENEYEQVATMFTDLFEGRPVILPKKVIKMKNGIKTVFAQRMGIIHKELAGPKVKMKSNHEFLNIFNVLSQFKGESNEQIYSALKR